MSDAVMSDAVIRDWARELLAAHDPQNQSHAYNRCGLCGYVRHPCDTFDLCETVITLLDRLGV